MATDFAHHLRELEAFLRKDGDAPSWDDVQVVMDSDITHGPSMTIAESALHVPEQFSPKFDELVLRGYGWINLVGNGLIDGKLLVSLEVPRESSGIQSEQVHVNLSGPYRDASGRKRWNLEGRVHVK